MEVYQLIRGIGVGPNPITLKTSTNKDKLLELASEFNAEAKKLDNDLWYIVINLTVDEE